MRAISPVSKALLVGFALSAALVGCGRDEQAAQETRTYSPDSRSSPAAYGDDQQTSKVAGGTADSSGSSAGASEKSSTASGSDSSTGQAIDDSVITTKAKTALLADTNVRGTDINVETNKGVVLLSGTVADSKQKERAASIVRGLDGVQSVENKLTIKK
jgi:hyperosmotically inducible protein